MTGISTGKRLLYFFWEMDPKNLLIPMRQSIPFANPIQIFITIFSKSNINYYLI